MENSLLAIFDEFWPKTMYYYSKAAKVMAAILKWGQSYLGTQPHY